MRMNTVHLLTFLGLTSCSSLTAAAKPTIIASMADNTGFECMSANGNRQKASLVHARPPIQTLRGCCQTPQIAQGDQAHK